VIFFAGRGKGSKDGQASRARIRELVQAEPGIHVSQLADRLGLSWHTIAYHLRMLETTRDIVLEKEGRERRAYPAGISYVHRRWLAGLRTARAADVLRSLLDDPRQTVPALSRRMGYSEKVVRRQVANLAEAGLLERHGKLRPVYELSREAAPELADWLRRGPDRGPLPPPPPPHRDPPGR
jgi:predicted transcriptional regulator